MKQEYEKTNSMIYEDLTRIRLFFGSLK